MKVKKCISCKERPIEIKKWKRCKKCYRRYNSKKRSARFRVENYNSKMDFIKFYFTHNKWFYRPAIFSFNNGAKLEFDFYDGKRNVFIIIFGSTFNYHKEKYKKFKKAFPKINFEIRRINGDLVDLFAEKYHRQDN